MNRTTKLVACSAVALAFIAMLARGQEKERAVHAIQGIRFEGDCTMGDLGGSTIYNVVLKYSAKPCVISTGPENALADHVTLPDALNIQDKKPELTDSGSTITYGGTTLNMGPEDEIVHCDNADASGRPSKCRLMGKHTLDDVIQYIWQDGENRREMYKEQADALRQYLKQKDKTQPKP